MKHQFHYAYRKMQEHWQVLLLLAFIVNIVVLLIAIFNDWGRPPEGENSSIYEKETSVIDYVSLQGIELDHRLQYEAFRVPHIRMYFIKPNVVLLTGVSSNGLDYKASLAIQLDDEFPHYDNPEKLTAYMRSLMNNFENMHCATADFANHISAYRYGKTTYAILEGDCFIRGRNVLHFVEEFMATERK